MEDISNLSDGELRALCKGKGPGAIATIFREWVGFPGSLAAHLADMERLWLHFRITYKVDESKQELAWRIFAEREKERQTTDTVGKNGR